MAKGRKTASNRHERFLGNSVYNPIQGGSIDGSELGEEEVWSMVDHDDQIQHGSWSCNGLDTNQHHSIRNGRWMSKEDRDVGGLSLAFDDGQRSSSKIIVHHYHGQDNMGSPRVRNHMAASAPMNVPNWSNVGRVDSVNSLHDSDDDELEDHGTERVPPHEYLAREYARSHKSVFEGVGRTLKGRDLSRVRDAVWSQTGFDG